MVRAAEMIKGIHFLSNIIKLTTDRILGDISIRLIRCVPYNGDCRFVVARNNEGVQ